MRNIILPFVKTLHITWTHGRMIKLDSPISPYSAGDIGQMVEHSSKCPWPQNNKKLNSPICHLALSQSTYDHLTALQTTHALCYTAEIWAVDMQAATMWKLCSTRDRGRQSAKKKWEPHRCGWHSPICYFSLFYLRASKTKSVRQNPAARMNSAM